VRNAKIKIFRRLTLDKVFCSLLRDNKLQNNPLNRSSKKALLHKGLQGPLLKIGGGLFLILLLFITITGLVDTYAISSRNVKTKDVEFVKPVVESNEPNNVSAESVAAVGEACKNIYTSRFEEADKLLAKFSSDTNPYISRLQEVTAQYQKIEARRNAAREETFEKEMGEIEKIRAAAEANSIKMPDISDVNDANDVNDLTRTLSVIARTAEYADKTQKEKLLSMPFVKETFEKAISKANEYESKGKWLDAYLVCYSWLASIDANTEEYTKHSEELVEKANIVASFQDSPCETSRQRYDGIKKESLLNAIDILESNYVNRVIDYQQMIVKALQRCRLLGEVLSISHAEIAEGLSKSGEGDKFIPPDSSQLKAWFSGLEDIRKEADKLPLAYDKKKFTEVCEKIIELNSKTAKLPQGILIAQFAEAALSALDPYTVMVWPQQTQEFEKMMTNEFSGIGVEISKPKGMLTIASLLPDTPAYLSGLDAGDIIEAVDDVPTKDMSLTCAVKTITGPAGTRVKLTIRRSGEEQTKDITITRASIVVPTIYGWQRNEKGEWVYFVDNDDKIAYVRITSFSDKTGSDLEKVLKKLEAEGMRGLIIDLRFNSGGLLNVAAEVADKFLSEGVVVCTRPRFGIGPCIYANKEGTHPNYPLVILINSGSASASEIVAGALADEAHKRAILVGERTHGKGSVQTITERPGNGTQLKYTMAYYHLPSGQRVESQDAMKKKGSTDWGVGPNVEVKMGSGVLAASDELRKMLDIQRANDVLVQAGHKEIDTEKKYSLAETLEYDPQLEIGSLIVKSKLIEARNSALKPSQAQTAAK